MTGFPPGPVPPQGVPGQPPQGPPEPQPITPPRIPPPQQPDTPAAQIGSDAPAAFGALRSPEGAMAPPAWDGWLPPLQLPGNHAEQKMVLDRMRQEWQHHLARQQHAGDVGIMQGVQDAPLQADQLLHQIRMDPDQDFSEQLSELEPFLPQSKAKHIRTSHDRIRKMRGQLGDWEKEVETTLRKDFSKDVHEKGGKEKRERRYDEIGEELKAEHKRMPPTVEPLLHAVGGDVDELANHPKFAPIIAQYKKSKQRIEELQRERDALDVGSAPVGMSDVTRGLGSIVTGKESVEDAMLSTLREKMDKRVSPAEEGYAPEPFESAYRDMGIVTQPKKAIEGFSNRSVRAAMADVAMRKVGELKRNTTSGDLVGAASATLPWMATGMGEIAVSAKVVQGMAKVLPWLKGATKLGSFTSKAMTYAGGPALMEFSYGMVRPLPGTRQAEVDAIEDPKLAKATEEAFRFHQASLDAAMAVAFSVGDIARAARSVEALKHTVNNPGRALTDAAKLGLVAPAAAEGTNVLLGEAATAMAANEGEAADVLRDLYAAKGMYGPIQQFLDAKTGQERLDAAMEYGKQALPMMAGIGAVHAMTGLGVRFQRRAQMLELRRMIGLDLTNMSMDEETRQILQRTFDEDLERLAPTKQEDARAVTRRRLEQRLGDAAESAIQAEAWAGRLLPDAPGRGLSEKLDLILSAHREDSEGASPELRRDLDIATLLDQLRIEENRDVADQIIAELRRLDGDDRPLDQIVEDGRLQDAITNAEEPGVNDAAAGRAADDADAPLVPVGRDPDKGTITVRQDVPGDRPVRLTVPDDRAGKLNITKPAEPGWGKATPEIEQLRAGELTPLQFVNRVVKRLDAAGGDAWLRFGQSHPELRGSRRRPTKMKIKRELLRQAKDYAEGLGMWSRPENKNAGNLQKGQRGRNLLTELEQMGGLTEDQWRRAGVDVARLREHPNAKRLIRPGSTNKWGRMAEALKGSGWMEGRLGGSDESVGSGNHEAVFGEMVQAALNGERIINWKEGGLSDQALQDEYLAWLARTQEPEPDEPGIIDEVSERAVEAIKGGATSGRALAEALGISRTRAGEVLKGLFDAGLLVKKGRGYGLAEKAGEGMTREADAREDEARQITDRILGDAAEIAQEFGRTGDSISLEERAARMATDIADYGDLVRPDDPQLASAELASRAMLELPPEARTDAVIRQLGMGETDVAIVRELMRQREDPRPVGGNTTSLTHEKFDAIAATIEGRTRLDKAMREPTTEGLPEDVRLAYEEAQRAGSEDAAEQAWAVWREANPDAPERPLSSEIERHAAHLDSLNRDIVSLDGERQQKAVHDLADLVGGIRDSDEWTGLLSLDEKGRAYLQRLNAIWHGVTVKRELAMLPGQTGERKPSSTAERKRKAQKIVDMRRAGERGSVPVLAPAVILISPAIAAYAVMRAGLRTMAKVWKHALRAAGKAMQGMKWPASSLVTLWRNGTTSIVRQAQRIEQRAFAAISENVGKYSRGIGLVDNQTKWGEIDLIISYERAAFNARLARKATERLNRVIQEDSQFDHDFNRALEIMGTAHDNRQPDEIAWLNKFEAGMTDEQRDVVDAVREMYASIRQLVAGQLLPTQQQRRRDLRLLDELVVEAEALERSMHEGLEAAMEEGDKKAVGKAKKALKKAQDKLEAAKGRSDRLRLEGSREKARWGITERGFAPAVPNRDPKIAIAEAQSLGKLSEGEVMDLDVQEALRDLAATSKQLRNRAHDFVHSEIPPAPRAGHWMTRKGTLEAAGAREQSSVRSFFQYVNEVYRLIPASQWYEQHYERLWGTEKWVSANELDKGMLEGGGHVVEYISDRSAPSARRRTQWRLGGSAYGLKLEGPNGGTQTVWFRKYSDWKAAREADGSKILSEGWKVAEEQMGAKQHLLLHHQARAGAEMTIEAIGTDNKTKRLLLPDHDVKAVLPTNSVGTYIKKVGGKYAAIRRMSGKRVANDFAAYVDQSMQRMLGRELLTTGERFSAGFSSAVRHKLLGMLQPSSAIKESMDNFLAYAIHSGVQGAFEASHYSLEFSERLRKAEKKLGEMGTRAWLQQHTPNQRGDIIPPVILDGMRTPKKKLDAMAPEQRQEAEYMDDAYVAFMHSALSGDSISEHLGVVTRQGGYGQKMFLTSGANEPGLKGQLKHAGDAARHAGSAMGDASWYLRRRAQSYGMRMTWIGAYMTQRKAGKTDSQAIDIANRFALAQGNVGNRLSQGELFQTWYGRVIKPLASWSLATTASNMRQLFQHTGGARTVALTTAKRLAYFFGMYVMLEQMGMFAEMDLGNSLGGKVSQIPAIGPMAAYSTQELLAKMHMAADPADASRELPEWRQKLIAQAREHAPDWLREYLVRRGATVGGFPADVPIPMLAGTWSPYVADAAQDFYKLLTTSDDKQRANSWNNLTGANFDWMRAWNRFFQTTPDTSDPNYLLIKNPSTGHMQERVRKGEAGAAIWNLLMPDTETSIRRMERGILQPRRDELRASTTRNIAFHAQKHLIDADKLQDELRSMQSPEQRQVTQKRIKDLQTKFNMAVGEYAKERELNFRDAVAVDRRWREVAKAAMSLTGRERDIINAYDTDSAFRLWASAMDDVSDPMTKGRFDKVMGLRYSSPREMFTALAKQKRETVDRFMASYRTARVRWSIERKGR